MSQALHHPENYVLKDEHGTVRVSFKLDGEPQAQGSKRGFRNPKTGAIIITEASAKTKPWRQEIVDLIRHYDLGVGFIGPVQVGLDFYLQHPKAHYRTGRNAHLLKANAPDYVSVKPDADKLARSVLDALTIGGVFRDDSQVAVLTVQKRYAESPGVRVTVSRL